MGKPTGFLEYAREEPTTASAAERVKHYREFTVPLPVARLAQQGARCMDCGVPFCHAGCPLGNAIPDWNELIHRGEWRRAVRLLQSTNNFPEFTGRVCPAPCEEACVLGINAPPVTVKNIELAIIERAFRQRWIKPEAPRRRTPRRVAVVGSGPAGLACADQLNRAGHGVTVFERADRIGGLLRYGIPDFKMEKRILDRRLQLMNAEGVSFKTGIHIGADIHADDLRRDFHAVVLCGGATRARDFAIPGRELVGIHLAMEFLAQQNRRVAGGAAARPAKRWWFTDDSGDLSARGKRVIVLGGGDTGSDCVGTCNRQDAASVTQFEILAKPTEHRPAGQPWPYWPTRLRTSTSHEEGCARHWSLCTKRFLGARGRVKAVETVAVRRQAAVNGAAPQMQEVPGSEKTWPADLVLLALGFVGPEPDGIVTQLGAQLDECGNVKTDHRYMTNVPGVFACGDMRRGQSLVVWAISEGREAARAIDVHLMGSTLLAPKGEGDLPCP